MLGRSTGESETEEKKKQKQQQIRLQCSVGTMTMLNLVLQNPLLLPLLLLNLLVSQKFVKKSKLLFHSDIQLPAKTQYISRYSQNGFSMANIQTGTKHQCFYTSLCFSMKNSSRTNRYDMKSVPLLESLGRSWQSILHHIPCP